jgi:TolB-like protein/class 3 adenylate cyclase/Tfp pilus assembly protein PilF
MAREQRRLAAIVAADVVGYSRLMGRDESGTLTRLREHRKQRFEPVLARHGGRLVKLTGDGALTEFGSAVDALSASIEFQQAMEEANRDQPHDTRIVFRIGLHLGDLIVEGDDLYGDGVNVAARLEAEAPAGGIVVSGDLHNAVAGRLKATFEDLGSLALKNIERPIQAFRVGWDAADWKASVLETAPADSPSLTEVPLTLPDKPSIAVLPFTNMSGDPEQEHFADGMTEDIITELSRFRALFVIARNSTFTYKGRATDVRLVGRELGVRYVLEGSVRRAGDRVRVTAQLIDALNGAHLWAERYDRVLEDIFAVQEEVTHNIVVAVAPMVETVEVTQASRRKPADLTAYGLAQKAWFVLAQDFLSSPLQVQRDEVASLARDALSRDSHCVLAMNALATVHYQNAFYGTVPLAEGLRDGLEILQQALAIDPRDHLIHFCKGWMLHGQRRFDEAIASLRRAHEINPNDARALATLGWVEACSGNAEVGIAHLREALRHDPKNPSQQLTYVQLAMSCFVARDHVQGLEWSLRACAERDHVPPAIYVAMMHLVGLGRLQEARENLALLERIAPDFVRSRLEERGFSPYRRPEDQERSRKFLRIAVGLDAPSAAEAQG